MNAGERIAIAARYTFVGGGARLSGFLSSLSILGLILAIALLITVLSVMNGFDREMRQRILSLVPHVTLHAYDGADPDSPIAASILEHPEVSALQSFTAFDALFMRGAVIETARGIGLGDYQASGATASDSPILATLPAETRRRFSDDPRGLILGSGIAERLQAVPGDKLTLVVPELGGSASPRRSKFETVTLHGLLNTQTELDQVTAIVPLAMASQLAGLGDSVSGFQLATTDLFEASRVGWELTAALPPQYYATNWTMTHGNLYAAVQLSRDLVTILLLSVIAVAAFNVVSSLVLVVFDKRGDIAILRTLGAKPTDVAKIFLWQGAMIGIVGVILGALSGVLLSLAVPSLVDMLETVLGIQFLSTDVYPVSFIPVEILPSDVILVAVVSFVLCLLSALYPARRAARLAPATVLHERST